MANDLWPIRCIFMRGGTSRGPFFNTSDLPQDVDLRDRVLISVMGSGHPLQIDGMGGGHAVTSKVAIVGRSERADADVDYLFAQVSVSEHKVDTSPNCGNMLAGVAPFAIETGIIAPQDGVTHVRIFNVNTGQIIEASVETPAGQIAYRGDTAISGVPGRAPHRAHLRGRRRLEDGRAASDRKSGRHLRWNLGLVRRCGHARRHRPRLRSRQKRPRESGRAECRWDFLRQLEAIRVPAGQAMGLADAAELVIPKPVLVAPAEVADITARYFMPKSCHPSLAATGSIAIAMACCTPGTIAAQLLSAPLALPTTLSIAHPSGYISVALEQRPSLKNPTASIVRTARMLFQGTIYAGMAPPAAG